MSLIKNLVDTYNNNINNVCNPNDKTPLYPLFHTSLNTQILITLNKNGEFIRASIVDEKNSPTIIPCTEKSGSRTSGIAPHPLIDKLQYLSNTLESQDYHAAYKTLLTDWCNHNPSNPKLIAILKYINSNTIMDDLKTTFQNFETKEFMKNLAKKVTKLKDIVVKFEVDCGLDNLNTSTLDKELFDSWIDFYTSTQIKEKRLCYISGKVELIHSLHPKKIRNTGDGAKLFSANDTGGGTYLGRFTNAEQAMDISAITSEKAHSALRWLIGKQGIINCNGITHLAWSISNKTETINIDSSTFDLWEDCENIPDTGTIFAQKFKNALLGYGTPKLENLNNIAILGLKESDTRFGITYYRCMNETDFINKILNWHIKYAYIQEEPISKKIIRKFYGAPSPLRIAQCSTSKYNDNLIYHTRDRILSSIIDGRDIPLDIIQSCANRTISTSIQKDEKEWKANLKVTCSLITGNNGEKNMNLNRENTNRNYLFGRILATLERAEGHYNYINEIKHRPKAKKLFKAFSNKPAEIYQQIREHLENIEALTPNYERELKEIVNLMPIEGFSNKKLDFNWLVGYDHQIDWWWDTTTKKKETTQE